MSTQRLYWNIHKKLTSCLFHLSVSNCHHACADTGFTINIEKMPAGTDVSSFYDILSWLYALRWFILFHRLLYSLGNDQLAPSFYSESVFKNILQSHWIVSVCSSPSESDSERSLSGFETVASHSFEEDEEEEDEGSVMLSSPCSSPTSMLQEDHHGDKDKTQPNGITKHRSAVLYAPTVLLSNPHQKMN